VNAKLHLYESSAERFVGEAVETLNTSCETLRGLAEHMQDFGDLQRGAEAERLRLVAIGLRASALQSMLAAASVVGVADRFALIADVYHSAEAEQEND
jgi:hypothetical protein